MTKPIPESDTLTKDSTTSTALAPNNNPAAPKKSYTSLYTMSGIMLSLIAVGISVYTLTINKQQQKTFSQQVDSFRQELSQTNNKLQQRQIEIAQLEQHLYKITDSTNQNDWQMQAIAYLIQLADLNLRYQHDPNTAISLLTKADEQIAKLNNSRLTQLRQMLARDIASVRAVQAIDLTGILTKLQALAEQVNTIPTLTPEPVNQKQPPAKIIQTNEIWYQRITHELWHAIKNLVTIRYYDTATKPLITEEQRYLLTTLIQTHLTQAQWAALHYNQALFQQNLQQAIELSQINFGNSPQKTAFLAQLTELQRTNLTLPMPELTNTLAFLSQLTSDASKNAAPAKPITDKTDKSKPQESALV